MCVSESSQSLLHISCVSRLMLTVHRILFLLFFLFLPVYLFHLVRLLHLHPRRRRRVNDRMSHLAQRRGDHEEDRRAFKKEGRRGEKGGIKGGKR